MADRNTAYTCGGLYFSDNLTEAALPRRETEAHSHHDEAEIYWFLEGDLVFAFEGDRIPVTPGDMFIVSSGQLHRPLLKSTCRYFRKRILFRPESLTEFCPAAMELHYRLSSKRLLHLSRETVAQAGLDQLFTQLTQEGTDDSTYGQFGAMATLCYFLKTAEALSPGAANLRHRIPSGRAEPLLRYIDEHLDTELSYQTLAAQAHTSVKSLYQFFKQETGFPLGQYIRQRRIIRAKTLLNAGVCAAEAAALTGFKDYSVFYRSFLRETGITPRQYAAEKADALHESAFCP